MKTPLLLRPNNAKALIIVGLVFLAGCVSISKTTSIGVWSHAETTFISVEMPTNETSFNWHGGGWMNGLDRYKISIPREMDHVDGEKITLNRGIGATDRVVQVGPKSYVEVAGRGACTIDVHIYNEAGIPYALNGIYWLEGSCGR